MSIDSASWMFCPFVHFFLDRQKVSLKNTALLPSLRSTTGWHFSAKVSKGKISTLRPLLQIDLLIDLQTNLQLST